MDTRRWARQHVPLLTAVLTVVSLAVVFGAALQAIPTEPLPAPERLLSAIPHVNAVISLAALGTITGGVRAIRNGEVSKHRALMLASFGLFVLFLGLYLYRVAILGPSEFPGPAVIETYVYLPILIVHILLAIVCVPFVFYALLLAGTRPVSAIYETNHKRAGRIAAVLWLISFAMGIVVYAMLYQIY
jgi:putative membrane protein